MWKKFRSLFKKEAEPKVKRGILEFEDNRRTSPISIWIDDDAVGYLNYRKSGDDEKGCWYFRQHASSTVNLSAQDMRHIAVEIDELNDEEV